MSAQLLILSANLFAIFRPRKRAHLPELGQFRIYSHVCCVYKHTKYRKVPRISPGLTVYMLWFNFFPGLNFIFLCLKVIIIHYHTPKQREIKFKPRIKLNHNIYIFARSFSRAYKLRDLYGRGGL